MNLELSYTSIINIFIMPESDDESAQSLFQGFLAEILDPQYIQNLSKFSIFPQEVQEIFMTQEELIYFRNHYFKPNIFLLRPTALRSFLPLLKEHSFVVLTYLPSDLEFISSIKNEFKYSPITASTNKNSDVNINQDFNCYILDEILYERLKLYVDKNNDKIELIQLLEKKSLRNKELTDPGFISRNHGVTCATESVVEGFGYEFKEVKFIPGSPEKSGYVRAIIEAASNLLTIAGQEKDISKSDLIVYSPSIYNHLYKFNSHWWNQVFRKIKNKKIKELIKNGVFKNPNYSGLIIETEEPFNLWDYPEAGTILSMRQSELALTTLAIQFLSILNCSPAIRLPNAINFHTGEIRELEKLSKLSGKKQILNFNKKFKNLVSTIKNEIGSELIEFIKEKSNSITLCTDTPLEWVSFDKIPLMFTHEISKIHTTPGNMFLLNSSQSVNVKVHKSELFVVTVIRSFKDNDPIKSMLEMSLKHFADIDNLVTIKIVDVSSEIELIRALNECNSHILIFDCHGEHGGSESHGWLQIGEDKVDSWSLTYKAPIPTIVLLSACLTSAVSGSHASFANGLIKSGALSVLGTFLPVDAAKSSIFMGRIIYRLSGFLNAVEKLGIDHLTWREFITGFFRMSYCTDILQAFKEDYKIIDQKQYKKLHIFGNEVVNSYQESWFEKVINAVSIESKLDEKALFNLVDEIGITESMYYMQLGRPENIRIIFKD
ncbi:hypothetical protein SG34_017705 [Thalassomonas viridans]|uniref:CHAT domain-containing protein n=1 Tax=Thalassomonas viridans TaxID=137584 RepID=A0AAE9YXV7_9GAMM|nr:hypothetical protein [Thalassomonas viridans]WDE03231.1 hypothetical protein SG34_017705 [Thalassomonas viridans]